MHLATRCIVALLTVVGFVALTLRQNDLGIEPRIRDQFLLLVVLLLCVLPDLLRSMKIYFSFRQKSSEEIRHQRPDRRHIPYLLLRYVMPTLVLYVSHDRLWYESSIGIASGLNHATPCFVGIFAAIVFFEILEFIDRQFTSHESPTSHQASTIRLHLPRGRLALIHARLDLVLISPAFEEILYRGFFIFFTNELLGTFVLGILIGLVLCLSVHLYQGIPNLINVVLFFFVTVFLLYSSFGLLSSFSFHATCNLRYTLRQKRLAEWYLETLNSRRTSLRARTEREKNDV